VGFFLGGRKLNNALAPDFEILAATSATLTFTEQKNGDKVDIIAHSRNGDLYCCLVTSTIRQFMLHRKEFRRRNTPYDGSIKLASYYNARNVRVPIKPTHVTKTLKLHAGTLQPTTGINSDDISA